MEQTFNKTIDLIFAAKKEGVEFILNGEKLQLRFAENKSIDKDLLEEIKSNKSSIIGFLQNQSWKSKKVNKNYNEVESFDRALLSHIPLSFAQERLWFIDRLEGSQQYHSLVALRLKGNLNEQALTFALKNIIDRHEVLRTTYYELDGSAYQQLIPVDSWQLSFTNGASLAGDNEGLQKLIERLYRQPFNLVKDFMLRATLVKLHATEHILVVTVHHIACDGWSIPVMIKEVIELYGSAVAGSTPSLPKLKLQYADFAVWEKDHLKGDVLQSKLQYWKDKLQGASALQMPMDYDRPMVRSTRGGTVNFRVNASITEKLKELSTQNDCSLYMTLLAAFNLLLNRYSNQTDISVGTSIANRNQPEIEGLIGLFVNTLVLRNHVVTKETFMSFLQDVKATTLAAYENQDVPFEKVVEVVLKDRQNSRASLFQVMLVLINTPVRPQISLGDLVIENEPVPSNDSKFDFTFFVNESSQGLAVTIEYSLDLYKAETITQLGANFAQLLEQIIENPSQKVGRYSLLTTHETNRLVSDFGKNKVDIPQTNLVQAFEKQAELLPGVVAVVFNGRQLTYKQVNEQANQVAHLLISKGTTTNDIVPLCVERSDRFVVCMLGILKAGAAYLPIEPDFPAERISYMLENSKARFALFQNLENNKEIHGTTAELIDIDDQAFLLQPVNNPSVVSGAGHLAYIIYTSGSTGKPKGVMISHHNIVDYVFGLQNKLAFKPQSSYALVSSFATDLGNTVVFSSLLLGGTLHILLKQTASDAYGIHQYFADAKIDVLKIVPSHWKALQIEGSYLLPNQFLIFGGEALATDVVKEVLSTNPSCTIVNHYGPTETTIGKLLHIVDKTNTYGKTIPIGKPFGNTTVLVLTSDLQLCPGGVPGNLFIGGEGIAAGYLNNPELTASNFIVNPYDTGDCPMLYNTGDLVKYLPDGNILYINRVDDQVKIRGYRIELGEIENALQNATNIKQNAVLAKGDGNGDKKLVAFVVVDSAFDKKDLVDQLRQRLPEYMVPGQFVEMQQLPMTASGKVDRQALLQYSSDSVQAPLHIDPSNETEERLAEIWKAVLEMDEVSMTDDFFENGGHSLLAIKLVSSIRKEFGIEMPIGHVFDYPTLAQLAQQLGKNENNEVLSAIEPINPRPAKIPLSFSQDRLWFIDQLAGSRQYHIPAVIRLTGNLNISALEQAFKDIIQRHEVLRTVIREEEGKAFQLVQQADNWSLNVIDKSKEVAGDNDDEQSILSILNVPFDLAKDFMLRASLISKSNSENVLITNLHHIASDGWSSAILVSELTELYNAAIANRSPQLQPLPVQYADYAIWQRELSTENWAPKIDYWKQQLTGVASLQLPADFLRPAIQSTKGAMMSAQIPQQLFNSLHELGKQHGTTMFMNFLAAFNVLLYRYTNQNDICVGTPVAGRPVKEVEGLIGFFVNTLAIRSRFEKDATFANVLLDVKKTVLEAYENQDIPFEKIVEATVTERDISRNPVFQTVFSYQNIAGNADVQLTGLDVAPLNTGAAEHTTSKFDLTFNITETTSGFFLSVEYCTDLFEAKTISRMIESFNELLAAVCFHSNTQINHLSLIPAAEQEQVSALHKQVNKTTVPSKSVITLFTEQAQSTPTATALIFNDEKLSYAALNEHAGNLANYLLAKGTKPGDAVGLLTARSFEMIIGILGILKAGATYVPLNIDFPADRLNYILRDSNVSMIVYSDKQLLEKCGLASENSIDINDAKTITIVSQQLVSPLDTPVYIMYTSGTTGRPKGIAVSNQNVVNLACQTNDLQVFQSDVMMQWSNYGFDGSVYEIFGSLLNGAALVLLQEGWSADIYALKKVFETQRTTIGFLTTTIFNSIVDADVLMLQYMRKVVFGGEAGSYAHIRKAIDALGSGKLINGYGPTETTVFAAHCSFENIDESRTVAIGRPLDNVALFVLDEQKNVLPIGVTGELHIGGAGVSLGYINNENLTAKKFVHCFVQNTVNRVYKTGDLVRWNNYGLLEFVGRVDDQVKIRGHRIEISEIENVLQQNEQVSQAVVKVREHNASKTLVAYVSSNGSFDKDKLISWAKTKLPDYMVPTFFIEVESFALNNSGKIDKTALELPDADLEISEDYVAPRNELETTFVDLWKQLLGLNNIGINDNFFDIGGDSILTLQFVNSARRKGYELQPRDIFLHQTIAQLTQFYNSKEHTKVAGEQGMLSGPAGLLPIQQWYLGNAGQSVSHFNQSLLFSIKKEVTAEHIATAWKILFEQHDALRFIYSNTGGSWTQAYAAKLPVTIVHDLQDEAVESLATAITKTADEHQRSLDVLAGELVRVVLYKTPDAQESNRILIVIHHLAIDGVSWRILLENLEFILTDLVNGQTPAPAVKGSSYRQWYQALENFGQRASVLSQVDYWANVVERYVPLQLNDDDVVDATMLDLKRKSVQLSTEQTNNLLHEIPKLIQADVNDILLSALAVTMKTWGNVSSLTIGMEGHGREEIDSSIDISNTVGWFTNLYPLLIETGKETDLGKILGTVIEQVRSVPVKGLGYGVLKYINKEPKLAEKARWNIVYNYLGQLDNVVQKGNWIAGASESVGTSISEQYKLNEPLSLNCSVQNGQLLINWSYNSKEVEKGAVDILVRTYLNNVEMLINYCLEKSREVSTLSELQKKTVAAPTDYYEQVVEVKEAFKFLVPIKSTGNKKPLYIVAGGGGTAHKFMRFAKLMDPDQPIYVLQPPIDSKDLKVFPDTIEKIARAFNDEITRSNPTGPYALSGHCTGGKIALEMAKQLKASGKQIHMLAMFDTLIRKKTVAVEPELANLFNIPAKLNRFMTRIALKVNFEYYLLRHHTKPTIGYRTKKLKLFVNQLINPKDESVEYEYNNSEIFQITSDLYTSASRKYEIEPYDGEIILFYARERYYFTDAVNKINFKKITLNNDIKFSWKDYATSLKLYEINGDHSDIFEAVHGNEFAMLLQKSLDSNA